jgi:hypothetical protein
LLLQTHQAALSLHCCGLPVCCFLLQLPHLQLQLPRLELQLPRPEFQFLVGQVELCHFPDGCWIPGVGVSGLMLVGEFERGVFLLLGEDYLFVLFD